MTLNEIFMESLPYLSTLVGGVAAWNKDKILDKLGIKMQEKEIDHSTSETLELNLRIYQTILEDLDIRYKRMIDGINEEFQITADKLNADLDSIRKINKDFEQIISEQKKVIQNLNKSLKYYKNNCKCIADSLLTNEN